MNTKNSKKLITTAALLAILPFGAFAQDSTETGCEYEGGTLYRLIRLKLLKMKA